MQVDISGDGPAPGTVGKPRSTSPMSLAPPMGFNQTGSQLKLGFNGLTSNAPSTSAAGSTAGSGPTPTPASKANGGSNASEEVSALKDEVAQLRAELMNMKAGRTHGGAEGFPLSDTQKDALRNAGYAHADYKD